VRKLVPIVVKEIREALPATIFFLFLFHLIALTKAVSLDDFNITALRAVGATLGALIVGKAILTVEALPIARLFSDRMAVHVLWKTLLYGIMVLVFRIIEELIPLISKHGGLVQAAAAMYREVSWPLFGVLGLWILSGLFLYCLTDELVSVMGRSRVMQILFSARGRNATGYTD
jgi:ABC-type polysaccharide transport system permease subunit